MYVDIYVKEYVCAIVVILYVRSVVQMMMYVEMEEGMKRWHGTGKGPGRRNSQRHGLLETGAYCKTS